MNGRLGFGALLGAAKQAWVKQVQCDHALWIADAQRRIRGFQNLRMTMCLFPYKDADDLDVYALAVEHRGGGISRRLDRLIAGAVVGEPGDWTNKIIIDLLRTVDRQINAEINYVEGQPAFEFRPWY